MHRTDLEWEKWGARDPYFGVITADRFRVGRITEADREEFFASGAVHVHGVLAACRRYIDAEFAPQSVLDFGCGVGRLVVPFAHLAPRVVGVDVSPSMLAEARRQCDARAAPHAELVLSDDDLHRVQGPFDLVHSAIVLQHIEVERGRRFVSRLLELTRPGGVAALHLTYGKAWQRDAFGQPAPLPTAPPAVAAPPLASRLSRMLDAIARSTPAVAPAADSRRADPEMHMHSYNLSEIAYLLYRAGVQRFHADFSDHGGELGVMIYAARPPRAAEPEATGGTTQ
jgi:SAM-dependent methyltransferase